MVVNAVADDAEEGSLVRRRLRLDPDLHAPHLMDLEVLSSIRRRRAAGDLDDLRALGAVESLRQLRIFRHPHFPFARRIWELARNVTPYDAAYVALAETLRCTLVTADTRLAQAPGLRCEIEVLRVS